MSDLRQRISDFLESPEQKLSIFRDGKSVRALLPGAFDPLHEGHREMVRVAADRLGCEVAFELSIENVDEPSLRTDEIAERCSRFNQDSPLWITKAATFVEKAALFPQSIFVVGVDTIVRVSDARYYQGDALRVCEAIEQIGQLGCRFLVAGRLVDQSFQTLRELEIPERLQAICVGLTEEDFRRDISSTQIRREE